MVEKIEDCSIVLGTAFGLSQIQTILGIIVLSFQVLLILIKFFKKIYKRIKEKNFEGIENDVEETIDNLNKLKNSNE